jgi:hypothetical protein
MGDADAQPLVARSAVRSLSAQAAREHGKVRTEDPFGTPGHDEGNLVFDRARGEAQIRRQRIAQDRHSIFAGEIVDPAVALGLAEHRQDRRRRDFTRLDKPHEAGNVAGALGRNAHHINRNRRHGYSASPVDQKINLGSVQPMT